MSIASELSALQTDITNARTAITNKGGTVTSGGGSSQLATDIATIPTSGIVPTGNINITTTNQTDVTNYATAQVVDSNLTAGNIKDGVSILGVTGTYTGGGVGIPREVSAQGVYQMPTTSFTFSLPSNATDVGERALYYAFFNCTGITSVDLSSLTTVSGQSAMESAFRGCTNLTSVDLSSLVTVSGINNSLYCIFYGCTKITGAIDLSSLVTVSGTYAMNSAFNNCKKITSVDLSSLATVSGQLAMENTFKGNTLLSSIDLSSLTTIGTNTSSGLEYGHFSNCFYNCTNLTTLSFPNLEKIYCNGGSIASYGTFYNCNKVQKMYFPKLDTITYGSGASSSNQEACKYIFSSCSSLIELHFGAANQAAIEASPGYSTAWGRGAGNVTIYFDL